jgi:hypothetical protein
MLMPRLQRHDEGVAFFPAKRFTVDDGRAAAAEGVVNSCAVVWRGICFFSFAAEPLHAAGHGRQRRTGGGDVDQFLSGNLELRSFGNSHKMSNG